MARRVNAVARRSWTYSAASSTHRARRRRGSHRPRSDRPARSARWGATGANSSVCSGRSSAGRGPDIGLGGLRDPGGFPVTAPPGDDLELHRLPDPDRAGAVGESGCSGTSTSARRPRSRPSPRCSSNATTVPVFIPGAHLSARSSAIGSSMMSVAPPSQRRDQGVDLRLRHDGLDREAVLAVELATPSATSAPAAAR